MQLPDEFPRWSRAEQETYLITLLQKIVKTEAEVRALLAAVRGGQSIGKWTTRISTK